MEEAGGQGSALSRIQSPESRALGCILFFLINLFFIEGYGVNFRAPLHLCASLVAQMVKNLPAIQETRV